jgi:hypothetical protein
VTDNSLTFLVGEGSYVRTDRADKSLQDILAFVMFVKKLLTDGSRSHLDLRLNMRLFTLIVNKAGRF